MAEIHKTPICPHCLLEIDADSRYCEHCGVRLLACPDGHGFGKKKRCVECGKPLVEAEPTLQAEPVAPKVDSGDKTVVSVPIQNVKHPTHLICPPHHIRLRISDGAIIGRRGSFAGVFNGFATVSGLHAKLNVEPTGEVSITDLSSTNGTFVNGSKLVPNVPQPIKTGDSVAFYDLQFQVAE